MTLNYSIYSIPTLFFLNLLPVVYGNRVVAAARNGRPPSQANPRGRASLEELSKTCPQESFETWERCKAAHNNTLENLPIFAAALLSAHVARIDAATLNGCSAAFLGFRIAYVGIYVFVRHRPWSFLRSATWGSGVAVCFYLFYLAGGVLKHGVPVV